MSSFISLLSLQHLDAIGQRKFLLTTTIATQRHQLWRLFRSLSCDAYAINYSVSLLINYKITLKALNGVAFLIERLKMVDQGRWVQLTVRVQTLIDYDQLAW